VPFPAKVKFQTHRKRIAIPIKAGSNPKYRKRPNGKAGGAEQDSSQ